MRVTVIAGARRLDVRLPESVPVVELVPGLARRLGVLVPERPAWVVVTSDGRELTADTSLAEQDVDDGAVLALVPPAGPPDPTPYDDPAEVVADAVAARAGWTPAAARAGRLVGGVAALALALGGLVVGPPGPVLAMLALGSAVLLAGVGTALARRRPAWTAALATVGCLHAGVGGFGLAAGTTGGATFGLPWAAGGLAAALAAGLVAAVVRDPVVALVPGSVGGLVAVAGTVVEVAGLDPRAVHAVLLVLVVTAMSGFGWLALSAAGVSAGPSWSVEPDAPRPSVASAWAAARLAVAHRVLVAALAVVGVTLALTAPFAVAAGPAGALLAVVGSMLTLLRTRHLRVAPEVGAGLAAGAAGLLATAAAAIVLQPGWRPGVVSAATALAVLLLVQAAVDPRPSLRWDRLCDLTEAATAIALLPLLAAATGIVHAAGG